MAEPHPLGEFAPILKNVYLPIRKKAWPKMSVLAAQARKIGPETAKFAGNDLFFDVVVGRRSGFVASNNGFAPESLVAREKQGRLGIARNYAKLFVDGLALKATSDPRGSYISVAKKLMEDVMDQWQIEQNRVLHGDGLAIRALIVARTSATVFTCASPYGITNAGPGNLHLEVGDTIAVHTAATLALVGTTGKQKISNITLSADTATVTVASSLEAGGGTIGAGDLVVTAVPTTVNATDTSLGAEPYGLKAIMDVENAFATFETINDPRWVAQKLTSASVDETVLMRLLNTIRARAGIEWRTDPKAMFLLTTTGIRQTYGESLLGLRRFSAPEMTLNGGFTGVQVAGATLVDDPWAPRGRIYAVYGPDTIMVDLMDFQKLSVEDAPEWQRASGRDGWEALMGVYWNYGVTRRNSHGVISGITDTANFSPVF
jgi:hypothetical protein